MPPTRLLRRSGDREAEMSEMFDEGNFRAAVKKAYQLVVDQWTMSTLVNPHCRESMRKKTRENPIAHAYLESVGELGRRPPVDAERV